jgi:hypothetical protein
LSVRIILFAMGLLAIAGAAGAARVELTNECGGVPAWAHTPLEVRIVFLVRIDARERLILNHSPATPQQVRDYLNQPMWDDPLAPAFLFERSPQLSCDQVTFVRQLIADTRACRAGQCAEVTSPPPMPGHWRRRMGRRVGQS